MVYREMPSSVTQDSARNADLTEHNHVIAVCEAGHTRPSDCITSRKNTIRQVNMSYLIGTVASYRKSTLDEKKKYMF